MRGGRNNGKYGKACLTMHQPWASLLVHGIKRIEGRSWPAPLRGRLWIHAAGKVPDDATIKAMEDFYREIYAVDGITDLQFPEHYPVSKLIGCVEVIGCLRCEELACWKEVPEGVRLEGLTDFCWLCEQPQKLLVSLEMRGYHGVYDLERKIYEAAMRNLVPVGSPLPVKFPLPNLRDPFSLKPGSISIKPHESKATEVEKSSSLCAAIAGARAAATQFSKKSQSFQTNIVNNGNIAGVIRSSQSNRKYFEDNTPAADKATTLVCPSEEQRASKYKGNSSSHRQFPHAELCPKEVQRASEHNRNSGSHMQFPHAELSHHPGAPFKIFAEAVRGLKPA